MKKTITKQVKKVLCAIMCGAFLLANETVASAATEAIYEYDVERGEGNVYRGVVNTNELNVRTAAGKKNPIVQVDGKNIQLNKRDEIAILDEAWSSGEKWYKVSFQRGEALVVGYVHGSYVDVTADVIAPLPRRKRWLSALSKILGKVFLSAVGIGILVLIGSCNSEPSNPTIEDILRDGL